MAKMTDEHKAALAKGRAQARAVKGYLEHLERGRKRGPKASKESLTRRLEQRQQAIATEDDPIRRLELIQKRMDDEDRLAAVSEEVDEGALEADFAAAAREYGERKGISYAAWRELGVPAQVLKQAGVSGTRRG